MEEPALQRPVISARTRRTVVSAGLAAAALFSTGMLAGVLLHRAPSIERITVTAPAVKVDVPPAPAPVVSVNVPPAPAQAPAPPAPSASPSPMPVPVVPRLWPECVAQDPASTEPPTVCGWADGFPAIAGDGSQIATKYIPDDGGRGNPGVEIHFLDAHTGKTVRTFVVLDPDEFVTVDADGNAKSAKAVERMQSKVWSRTAEVQKLLDDGHFRTMSFLGNWDRNVAADTTSTQIPHTGVYAEITEGGAARIIDSATNTVLLQQWFSASASPSEQERLKKFQDGEGMCGAWGMREMSLWWDEAERVIVSTQDFQTGGCMCPDETVEQVVRMPALQR